MIDFVFKRVELKYRLTREQYHAVRALIDRRLSPDAFGETTVQSLYYDTPDYRLARASIERPTYKEKLRARCYGLNDGDKDVFLEMKRKYDGVVYKRRIACKQRDCTGAADALSGQTQIDRELRYFWDYYGSLAPRILILYDRAAFFDPQGDLRVTFDRNVRYRTEQLDFHTSLEGIPLLADGEVLMELKSGTAFPLWLCGALSANGITKSSFSKYGEAYKRELGLKNIQFQLPEGKAYV